MLWRMKGGRRRKKGERRRKKGERGEEKEDGKGRKEGNGGRVPKTEPPFFIPRSSYMYTRWGHLFLP